MRGPSRNRFHTSSMAITTFSSSARGSSLRISRCERLHASRYEVCGFTTAGTSRTTSEPQSLAFCREVRMPAKLFSTTVGSLDDSGYFQWSMFMTESMRISAASAAFLSSSALCSSGSVGACSTSNPISRASLSRSAQERLAGNISRRMPFLIGGGAGEGAPATRDLPSVPARVAAQAAPAVDFRNRLRDSSCITPLQLLSFLFRITSPQPVQINPRFQDLAGLHYFIPCNLVIFVGGSARQNARNRRLRSFVSLIMKSSARYAIHKRFLFLAVSEFQIGSEVSRDREGLRIRFIFRRFRRRHGSLPRLIAPDSERSRVRRLRNAFCAEETLGDIPPAFGELRGAERHVDIVGIVEQHVVISVRVAVRSGTPESASGCGCFQRMPFENPVTDVDHVNVLLDDDGAGEGAVINPVAEAALHGRCLGPGRAIDVAGEIVWFAADDVAERAAVNAPDKLAKRKAVADLEADVEAELAIGALADFGDTQCGGYIDSHGLLKIDVLPSSDGGFEMLRVIVGRCGDDDRIHFLGMRNLLVSVGPEEEQRRIDVRIVFDPLELIEMRAGRVELIPEKVGQRDHTRVAGIDEIGRVLGAAPPAAEQPDPHRGVGRRAVNQRWLDEHNARRGCRRFQEFPSVKFA